MKQRVRVAYPSIVSFLVFLGLVGCLSGCGSMKSHPAYKRAYAAAQEREEKTKTTPLSQMGSIHETSIGISPVLRIEQQGRGASGVRTSGAPIVTPEVSSRWMWRFPHGGLMGPEIGFRGDRISSSKHIAGLLTVGLAQGGYDGEVSRSTTIGVINSVGYMRSFSPYVIDGEWRQQGRNGAYLRIGLRAHWRISEGYGALGLEAGLMGYHLWGSMLEGDNTRVFSPGFGWFPSLSVIYTLGSY